MALVVKDRVKETTTTTGTGSVTLSGAATGFQTFNSAIGVSNTTYYCIAGQGTSEWEVGLGTLSAGTTLARTTVLASSNGGTAVTFSAGTKDVFCTYPAGKSVSSDSSSAAQAWVNFNGTGTVAIRASFNVTSITDNGVGDYTINFTTVFSSADYAYAITGGDQNVTLGIISVSDTAPTASAFRFLVVSDTATPQDSAFVSGVFFGAQ